MSTHISVTHILSSNIQNYKPGDVLSKRRITNDDLLEKLPLYRVAGVGRVESPPSAASNAYCFLPSVLPGYIHVAVEVRVRSRIAGDMVEKGGT
jgi:hypothetical protein